jgi:Holliday junction resolvasome RuvABC endonuclease subunit
MSCFLGIDPGFASIGYAIVQIEPEKLIDLGVIRTEKSGKKRGVLASDDNLRRAREIHKALLRKILGLRVVAICAESMSFPRNASAAAKVAISWGVLASIAEQLAIPIVQASPQEIKRKLCGRKDASKADIEAAVRKLYKSPVEPNVPRSLREHAWDALSAIAACQDSDVLMMARRLGSDDKTLVSVLGREA